MKNIFLLSFLFLTNLILFGQQKLQLPAIFSDNMVLQQNAIVKFWGNGNPNSEIEILSNWNVNVKGKISSDSTWNLEVKTTSAGGPYRINITSDNDSIIFENVLLGEVWLCSGQSNMEMPLAGWAPNDTINNSNYEIENANYPNIRLFTVERMVSTKVLKDVTGKWDVCTPENIKDFSATAYFFGKKLSKELNIPIGLIHSSWGGTPAEAWTEVSYLKDVPGYQGFAEKLKELIPQQRLFQDWLEKHKVIQISDANGAVNFVDINFEDEKCVDFEFDYTNWMEMELPTFWEATSIGNFDGAIWFKKSISLPESFFDKELVLELGPIDDMDLTFFNGTKVGGYESTGFWQTPRKYIIPKELIKKGKNIISVRVIDTQGGGGIFGDKSAMKIYTSETPENIISIAGIWKFMPVAEYINNKFYIYKFDKNEFLERPLLNTDINSHSPTMLYNGMIAPIAGYKIRGAIWYQGESNVGRAEQYKSLFPSMISSWRNSWNQKDLPFYYVQIASYNYSKSSNSESAELREAQLSAMSLNNTGMAVTLDIGNPENIHPANKLDVGNRLALWALSKDYGIENLVYSGPVYKSYKVTGNKIEIEFDQIGSGIVLKNSSNNNQFIIAGEDKKFVPANVEIIDNKIIVWYNEISAPKAVRYCWTNSAAATLFNKEGLPASSFRTDKW